MQLSEVIIQRINNEGPVSFRDFMEMCLYYPGFGYYTCSKDKIGMNGDFYTVSNISCLFGAMIARQLGEMWHITGRKDFTVVEFGAGTGMLCHDILDHLKTDNAELYSKLHYYIIEKSAVMRQKEKDHLPDKVKWVDSVYDIPPFTGCVFSNELIDNFSVPRVVMKDELMEVFVNYENGFTEILRPAHKELINYLEELNVVLPKGFCTEINLEAIDWIKAIASRVTKGYVLTIDYGYTSSELYRDCRRNGTLLCYHKHTINDQPYTNIGTQDITAHINFSALSHWGLKYGLETCGLKSQAGFLIALGYEDYLSQLLLQKADMYSCIKQYAFLKHTLLIDMGQRFKVLIQKKGIPHRNLKCLAEQNNISFG
jgi:SAM-dependent MidA family methyltransferase